MNERRVERMMREVQSEGSFIEFPPGTPQPRGSPIDGAWVLVGLLAVTLVAAAVV
jgi:hypothetical protein